MTRAEAKEIIGAMSWEIYTQEVSDEKKLEALNMAIEALSENKRTDKHTETHACDCISRQDAIDEMGYCQTYLFDTRDKDKKISLEDVLYALEQLPSAKPFTEEQIQTMQELESAQVEKAYELGKADRPTGHWIENAQEYYEMINEKGGGVDENTPYFTDDIACSECLAKFSVIDNETERFDYCPNCGSYNGGGEE